jgi:hypothetical protein
MVKKFRTSPAFVLAFVALLVALGGSAAAGVPAKVARAISGSSIKAHSITGSKLKHNTLTGTQIAESKLSIVPKAKKSITAHSAGVALAAGNATNVGGLNVKKVSLVAKPGTSNQTIASVPGLNLIAACSITGNAGFVAQSTANGGDARITLVQRSHAKASTVGTTLVGADGAFDISQTIDLTRGAASGNGTLEYINNTNGQIAQVTYTFHNGAKKAPCVFGGVAFAG